MHEGPSQMLDEKIISSVEMLTLKQINNFLILAEKFLSTYTDGIFSKDTVSEASYYFLFNISEYLHAENLEDWHALDQQVILLLDNIKNEYSYKDSDIKWMFSALVKYIVQKGMIFDSKSKGFVEAQNAFLKKIKETFDNISGKELKEKNHDFDMTNIQNEFIRFLWVLEENSLLQEVSIIFNFLHLVKVARSKVDVENRFSFGTLAGPVLLELLKLNSKIFFTGDDSSSLYMEYYVMQIVANAILNLNIFKESYQQRNPMEWRDLLLLCNVTSKVNHNERSSPRDKSSFRILSFRNLFPKKGDTPPTSPGRESKPYEFSHSPKGN